MAYIYGSTTNCKVVNGQTRTEYECRLGYQVNSQDILTNTSNVTLRLEVRSVNSTYKTYGYKQTTTIDGVSLSAKNFDMRSTNTWQVFGERTITIYHNADGKYSANKSGSFTTTTSASSGGNYSLKSGSASVTVAPTTIPRASSISSITGNTIGSAVTVSISRKADSFTHNVFYTRFDGVVTQVGTAVGTSCTFTPHIGDCQYIPNSPNGTAIITVDTYSGSTKVGSVSQAITLNVPSSVVPTISSISVSAGNTVIPSSWGVYVEGKSQLKVVTSASGAYSSTIKSYKITGIDNNTYNSANFTSTTLQGTGEKTITVVVTDSRGRTATKTTTYTCIAYSNPNISVATVTRCNADGTNNEEGEYAKYSFKADIAPVSNKNTYSYKLGYRMSGESEYTYITIDNASYSLNKSNIVISDVTFSVDNSYDFEFVVTDYFTSSKITRQLGTGFTLLDFNASGKGMAIGKVSEKDALEIALPTEFTKPVTIDGIPIVLQNTYLEKVDINNIDNTSYYYCASCSNVPLSNGYLFTQYLNDNYTYQRYTLYDGSKTWDRAKNNGTWSSWSLVSGTQTQLTITKYLTNSWSANGSCEIFKDKNIVYFNISIRNGTNAVIMGLPNGFKPKNELVVPTVSTSGISSYLLIGTNGVVTCNSNLVGLSIFATYTYLAD